MKENLRQIPQIECVVALRRSGQKISAHFPVNFNRGPADRRGMLVQPLVVRILGQVSLQNRIEDHFHWGSRQFGQPEHVKVTEQPRRHCVSATSRRSTSGREDAIPDPHKLELLQIVEPSMVNHLSQQLNWRLSAVDFKCWHIDIVNEDNHLASAGRAQQITSLFLQFITVHEKIQQILWTCLSTEIKALGKQIFLNQVASSTLKWSLIYLLLCLQKLARFCLCSANYLGKTCISQCRLSAREYWNKADCDQISIPLSILSNGLAAS